MAAGLLTGLLTTVGLTAPTAQPVPAENFEPVRHPHAMEHRLCHGYNDCRSDGYTDAGYKRERHHSYWKMYAGANCTNFVAYKLVRAGMPNARPRVAHGHRPSHLSAYRWGVVYRSLTDHRPTAGSVAWWAHRGRDGHVAWVEDVNRDGSLTISEDSWSGNGFDWRRIYRGRGWPTGFIHFKHRPLLPEHNERPHAPARQAPSHVRTLDLQAGSMTLVAGPAAPEALPVVDPAEPPATHVGAPEPHLKPR